MTSCNGRSILGTIDTCETSLGRTTCGTFAMPEHTGQEVDQFIGPPIQSRVKLLVNLQHSPTGSLAETLQLTGREGVALDYALRRPSLASQVQETASPRQNRLYCHNRTAVPRTLTRGKAVARSCEP